MKKNEALIEARKEKGLTQADLAQLMDCQKTTISNWETGYAKPKLSDAIKLCKILEKNIDEIFFENGVQETQTK